MFIVYHSNTEGNKQYKYIVQMELYREATKVMPRISFNNGKMSVVGRAIPVSNEGICDIFDEYVGNYLNNPDPITEISIDLDYVNCETQRCLAKIFKMLDALYQSGNHVVVNWFYEPEDEHMLELGNILQSLVSIPFQFIEKNWDKKNRGCLKSIQFNKMPQSHHDPKESQSIDN